MPRDFPFHQWWCAQLFDLRAMICSENLPIQGCWNLAHSFPQLLAPVQDLLLPPLSDSLEVEGNLSQGPAMKDGATFLTVSG